MSNYSIQIQRSIAIQQLFEEQKNKKSFARDYFYSYKEKKWLHIDNMKNNNHKKEEIKMFIDFDFRKEDIDIIQIAYNKFINPNFEVLSD